MPNTRISFENATFLPDRADSSVNLPPEVITTMHNWRLRDGVASVVPGYYNPITAFTSSTTLAANPIFATNVNFSDSAEIIYLSAPTGAASNSYYKVVSTGNGTISNTVQTLGSNTATFEDDPYQWGSFDWGEVTVLTHPQYAPMYVTAGASNNDMTSIPNWQSTDETNQLFPLGTFIVGLGYRGTPPGTTNAIRSDRVIITSNRITTFNEFPTWDLGNSASSTSAIYLTDGVTDGDLITGGTLNNFAVAYTDVASLRIDDNGDGTISLTSLFSDAGVLGKNSWCQIPNGHFVVGNNQVYTHDGSSKQVIGQDQWSEAFFSRIETTRIDEVQCVYNSRTDVVWMLIPTSTDKEIWGYHLSTGKIEFVMNQQNNLNWLFFTTEGLPFRTLTGMNIPFDTDQELYSSDGRAFSNRMIAMGGTASATSFFGHELGNDFGGATIQASLERTQIQPLDGYSRSAMMRAVPFYYGNGSMIMSFGGSNESGDATTYLATKTMTRGTDTKMDMRFTRRYLSYRITSSDPRINVAGFEVQLADKYRR